MNCETGRTAFSVLAAFGRHATEPTDGQKAGVWQFLVDSDRSARCRAHTASLEKAHCMRTHVLPLCILVLLVSSAGVWIRGATALDCARTHSSVTNTRV